jgi:ligand-binding SRPBCC domain-containing protein
MRYSYRTQQWLPYPVAQVFAFFAVPDNLPVLMPAWQRPRIDRASIVPPPAPPPEEVVSAPAGAAGAGSRMTLSFLPVPFSPLRLRWDAEISEFVWNEHFCDRQLSGPFAYWNHCHRVRSEMQSGVQGTLISDDLEYELPLGVLGRIAHSLAVRRQIEKIFSFRQSQLAQLMARQPGG